MIKYWILPLLLVFAMGLAAPLVSAQTTGTVKEFAKMPMAIRSSKEK